MSEASTSIERLPEAVVVRVLVRDLDETHIEGLRKGIAQALADSPSLPYIIDMSNVKFVPSLTLGDGSPRERVSAARSQRLIFVSLQPTVKKVIAIARLDRVMDIAGDVERRSTACRSPAENGSGCILARERVRKRFLMLVAATSVALPLKADTTRHEPTATNVEETAAEAARAKPGSLLPFDRPVYN